jgi:hypothetical protein
MQPETSSAAPSTPLAQGRDQNRKIHGVSTGGLSRGSVAAAVRAAACAASVSLGHRASMA